MSAPTQDNNILLRILDAKRAEVERQKQAVSLRTLLSMCEERMERPTLSMSRAIEASATGIIAEFKRRSPSKGWIYREAEATTVVRAYEQAGAAACSVLTDGDFFGGSYGDLQAARAVAGIPLLRKDFVVDEYQVFQARAMGADAVLLIAAALTEEHCASLAATAHSLRLEVLLEIHGESELSYLSDGIDMLGVNNRNLSTFHTDTAVSLRIAATALRAGASGGRPPLLVSESGISDPAVVVQLRKAGFRGFLIGETFMKTGRPGRTLEDFIKGISV
jgi:indole-3-glycerol phosphate synthase